MIRASIRKEVQLFLRDRGALVSLFLLPLIFVAFFGTIFSGDGSEEARLLPVHHAAGDERAARAVAAIERSGAFRPREEESAERVRELVAEEEAVAGLVFPEGFDPEAGAPAELVIDEAASPRVRGPITGALTGILEGALYGGDRPRVLEARTPPGLDAPMADIDGFQVAVPGNAVLFGFFIALTVGLSFVEERRKGTFRRLLAAPVRRWFLLVAKLVPYYVVGLVQMAFLFGLGAALFGMRIGGDPLALVALTAAVVFAAVALGLLVASFSGTEKQVGAIGSICVLVMGLVGGAMIPRITMPETVQTVGLLTPQAWALDGYYDLLIREGTGLADVLPEIGAVFGFGVLFAAAGALRFRFER